MFVFATNIVNADQPIDVRATSIGHELRNLLETGISASLDGNTVTVSFASDFGAVEISIETLSGELVTSNACLFTPDDAVLNVSGTGTFVVVIETSTGTFTGQFTIN